MSGSNRPTAFRLYNPCALVSSGLTAFSRWWLGVEQQQAADHKARLSCRASGSSVDSERVGVHVQLDPGAGAKADAAGHSSSSMLSDAQIRALVQELKPKIFDWDLDIFDVHQRSGGHALLIVTLTLLEVHNLLDGWKLQRQQVVAFLQALERHYRPNPYHNSTHAADVTQAAAIILRSLRTEVTGITQLEVCACILGAAVHDLAHPGVNNDFLINSRDSNALLYNDRSVNENFHVSTAFTLAYSSPELNVFSGFSREEEKQLRTLIINIVLATDMAVHFDLLERFSRESAAAAAPEATWQQRSVLLNMVVHLADLCNPSRPFPLARRWAELVVSEFLQQGEKEAAVGLPISPMCNKELVNVPKAQLGFINIFLKATIDSFKTLSVDFHSRAAGHLAETVARWEALLVQHVQQQQQV